MTRHLEAVLTIKTTLPFKVDCIYPISTYSLIQMIHEKRSTYKVQITFAPRQLGLQIVEALGGNVPWERFITKLGGDAVEKCHVGLVWNVKIWFEYASDCSEDGKMMKRYDGFQSGVT